MAIATVATESVYSTITLKNVEWETYEKLRDEPRNDRVRMTYLDGTLILMSPEYIHDIDNRTFETLLRNVTEGLGLEIIGAGSATFRRPGPGPRKGAAKEPDSAFFLGENERWMRGKKAHDVAVDPAPDLAIEVINKNDSKIMLATYARIGVTEVWRYDARRHDLWFGRIDGASYRAIDRSSVMPRLTPSLVIQALDVLWAGVMGQNAWAQWLREWARDLPEPPA